MMQHREPRKVAIFDTPTDRREVAYTRGYTKRDTVRVAPRNHGSLIIGVRPRREEN